MKKQVAIVALALTLSTAAVAGERATSAALGAVSGAVVLGPIGAVAGAFIGYTAGPSMSRAWGVRGRSASVAPAAPDRQQRASGPIAKARPPCRVCAGAPSRRETGAEPPAVQPLE